MSITCDECENYVHDKEEFRFIFKLSDDDRDIDCSLSLCSRCFDDKFSIKRYARLCAKDSQLADNQSLSKGPCCLCDKEINKKKQQYNIVRCFNNKAVLEIIYCQGCYADDVGI